MLRDTLIALYRFLRMGCGEGGADLFSVVYSVKLCGMVQSCVRVGSDLTLGIISLLSG